METPVVTQPGSSNGLAVASLVVGILAVLSGAVLIGALLGVTAIILGAIALSKKSRNGMAVAGIITGSVGIVISIAVVGLVLLAMPALQRNQRDVGRKNELGLIATEITDYKTNNNGALPEVSALAGHFGTAKLDVIASGEPSTSTALYQPNMLCDGSTLVGRFALTTKLESGDQIYCVDY